MSGIKGKQKEYKSFDNSLKVGFFEAEVVSINPDKEELVKLLNVGEDKIDNFKDPEYLDESKEGNARLRISVWLKHTKTGNLYNKAFFLEKKPRTYQENDESEESTQYINDQGRVQWATEEAELSEKFTQREYRVAFSGEDKLYGFLRCWLRGIDFKNDPEATILMDTKQLFNGNVKELRSQIGGLFDRETNPANKKTTPYTVIGMAEVKTKEEEGEVKSNQSVYDLFLPGYMMKNIRNTSFTEENIEAWREKKGKKNDDGKVIYLKAHEDLAVKISDSKNGTKNFYFLGEIKEYDPSENPVGKKEKADETDASY